METKNIEKKINTFFIICVVFATLGIILTITYFIYHHIKLIFVNTNELILLFFEFLLLTVIIPRLFIRKNAIKILMCSTGISFVAFSILALEFFVKLQLVNITIFSICVTIFLLVLFFSVILFAFIFKRKKALALENDKRKKALALEINQNFLECEKDYNLWNLMAHLANIDKNIDSYENLPINTNEKEQIEKYKNDLLNKKQKYIRQTILNHYKIICDSLETKQLHLSKEIYSSCQNLKDSINQFANQFNEENQKISSIISERINLIATFAEKYIDAYNLDKKSSIDNMNGQYFEKYCANLLISYGFVDVHITPGSGDQGVDIIGKYNNLKYAVQCKRYSSKLGNTPVQEVTAGKNYYQCECALVITNNFFTDGAIKLAKANNIELWDRNKLLQLIYYADNQWNNLLEKIKINFQEIHINEKN